MRGASRLRAARLGAVRKADITPDLVTHLLAAQFPQWAELPVTRAEFLRFGLLLALISAALTYTLTGAILTPLFVGAGSLLMYLQWLFWRRDALRVAYEEALADLCDRMLVPARTDSDVDRYNAVIVDPATPGITVRNMNLGGIEGLNQFDVRFDRVVVPATTKPLLELSVRTDPSNPPVPTATLVGPVRGLVKLFVPEAHDAGSKYRATTVALLLLT